MQKIRGEKIQSKPLSFETLLKSKQWYNYTNLTGINMDKHIHGVNLFLFFKLKHISWNCLEIV